MLVRKKFTITVLSLLVILTIAFITPAQAQIIDEVSDPGILPNSPLYFLQDWWQDIRLFFTLDEISKARLNLKYASQDVLAYKQLAQTANQELLDRITSRYQNRIKQANQWIEKANEQGNDISGIANDLKNVGKHQIEVLSEVYQQAPEVAKKGLETAIDSASKEIEQGIEKAIGPVESMEFNNSINEALNNAGIDRQIKIEQQIQNQTERADKTPGNINQSPNDQNSSESQDENVDDSTGSNSKTKR